MTESADAVVETVTETATETATEAVTETATETEEVVETTTEVATETTADPLSVEGFDLAAVTGLIDGAGLSQVKSSLLKTALDAAKDNPEALGEALATVKAALGM